MYMYSEYFVQCAHNISSFLPSHIQTVCQTINSTGIVMAEQVVKNEIGEEVSVTQ